MPVVRNFCDSESVRRPYKPDVQQIKLRPHKNGCQCKSCYCGCTHTAKLLLWLHTHFHIVIVAAHALPNYQILWCQINCTSTLQICKSSSLCLAILGTEHGDKPEQLLLQNWHSEGNESLHKNVPRPVAIVRAV